MRCITQRCMPRHIGKRRVGRFTTSYTAKEKHLVMHPSSVLTTRNTFPLHLELFFFSLTTAHNIASRCSHWQSPGCTYFQNAARNPACFTFHVNQFPCADRK